MTTGIHSLMGVAALTLVACVGGPAEDTDVEQSVTTAGTITGGGIYSLQVNTAGIRIGKLDAVNGTSIPSCDAARTQRECWNTFWGNLVGQGITGVRFMFDLNEPDGPFDDNGNVNPTWLANLSLLYADMKAAGIVSITPTVIWGDWTAPTPLSVWDACQHATVTLNFFKASPVAYDPVTTWADGHLDNDAYTCSPANPIFLGWTKIYAALDQVIARAQTAGLSIFEFDVSNELRLNTFPVHTRFIVDNKHTNTGDPNVYAHLRAVMASHGFDPGAVTYSTPAMNTTQPGFDCDSGYGESARTGALSALMNALQGRPYGAPNGFAYQHGLMCGGTTTGLMRLPSPLPLPDVIDVHAYNCVLSVGGGCDPNLENATYADSLVLYDGIEDILVGRGKPHATFVQGEAGLWKAQSPGVSCEGAAMNGTSASQAVNALLASALTTTPTRAARNVMRPWMALYHDCYSIHDRLVPPFPLMQPPTVTAAGGAAGCAGAWLTGGGFYPSAISIGIRDVNWNLLTTVTSGIAINPYSQLSFGIPARVVSTFEHGGLRFTATNTRTNAWATSPLVVCH